MATEDVTTRANVEPPPPPLGLTADDLAALLRIAERQRQSEEEEETKRRTALRLAHADDFRTPFEEMYTPGMPCAAGEDDPPAALVLNPHRTPLALAAAATSRADTLLKSISAWAQVDASAGVTATEVASILEPLAQELELLLTDLTAHLSREPQICTEAAEDREVAHG